MQKLKILNTREKKEVFEELKSNYGFSGRLEGVVFLSQNNEIFLLTGGFDVIEQGMERELRIDKAGLYIGRIKPDGVALSIEGSQLIGPKASKNIIEINDEQLEPWVTGNVLEGFTGEGYHIVKHKNDFLGCAKIKQGVVKNLMEKNRRIKTLNK